jgi:KAP family P-loop domain
MTRSGTAWSNDALNRKEEATAVADYLVARSNARRAGGLQQGFVLAVNADYGEGKSFFIQNLKDQLAELHPVALIDAWTDDRTQQPFLAILDALENALEPLFDKSETLRQKTAKMIAVAGPVAGGLARGMLKKGVERLAGTGAAGIVRDLLDTNVDADILDNEDRQAAVEEIQADVADSAEHGVEQGIARVKELADGNAKARLLEFRNNKLSALRLKNRLAQIAAMIESSGSNQKAPIFIFIDELDRCRPTYAIELLEEVKHLFDVAGVVFILCIHKEQLLCSIKSVYGADFAAATYLDRFIDKTYQLARPTSLAFVERELDREPLETSKFLDDILKQTVAQRIGQVFDHFGLSLREMERVIDMIRGCAFLTGDIALDPIFLTVQIIQELGKNVHEPQRPRESGHVYKHKYTTRISYSSPFTTRIEGEASLKDILSKVAAFGGWSRETLKQEEHRDQKKLQDEYAFQQVSKFYAQFPDESSARKTQAQICYEAIHKFMPFIEE